MENIEDTTMTDSYLEDESDNSTEESEEEYSESETNSTIQEGVHETKVYLPGNKLQEDEQLVADTSAYRLLHKTQTSSPCLSFDIIHDKWGDHRETYPLNLHLLAGTQAARTHVNSLLVIQMLNLHEVEQDDSSTDFNSDEEDENHIPVMKVASIKHQGCVNRVRCTQIGDANLAASWSELGRVSIWNLNDPLQRLENMALQDKKKCVKVDIDTKPIFTFKGHLSEGYAIDWCPTELGSLATGDCMGNIHMWKLHNNHTWVVDQRPYSSHAPHSVEDIQWSPNEKHVFASCSVDKSIKIWDTRANHQSACVLTVSEAHTADVNVISWNRKESRFLISGGDDGILCIWDLRQFQSTNPTPVAMFKQHTAPVTTVEWHPEEATVFASGGADDQITQWDLSVEVDATEMVEDHELAKLPPQLLFIHQGQVDIKELHWHPQCPGVLISTAHSGFDIFRTISV